MRKKPGCEAHGIDGRMKEPESRKVDQYLIQCERENQNDFGILTDLRRWSRAIGRGFSKETSDT